MEIDETLRKTVLENLNEIGISVDKIDERTMGHLARIESAIEDKLRERDDALETIKSCSLSVKSISEASGVSYQTFYNKPLLKEYVAQRRSVSGIDNSSEERARLRLKLNEAEERIKALEKRDAELVLARIENDQLRERIHLLEVQLAGGIPGGNGKGEVIPFPAKR